MANRVIGQTGSSVLSGKIANRGKTRRETVRFHYVRMQGGKVYQAVAIGPFHSRFYGVCGFGRTRQRAKLELVRNLEQSYGYYGNLIFSVQDEAVITTLQDPRLSVSRAREGVLITVGEER